MKQKPTIKSLALPNFFVMKVDKNTFSYLHFNFKAVKTLFFISKLTHLHDKKVIQGKTVASLNICKYKQGYLIKIGI